MTIRFEVGRVALHSVELYALGPDGAFDIVPPTAPPGTSDCAWQVSPANAGYAVFWQAYDPVLANALYAGRITISQGTDLCPAAANHSNPETFKAWVGEASPNIDNGVGQIYVEVA